MAGNAAKKRAKFKVKNIFKRIRPNLAYLHLQYHDAIKDKPVPFPKDTEVTVFYHNDAGAVTARVDGVAKIKGTSGKVSFKLKLYEENEEFKYISFGIKYKEETYYNITKKKLQHIDDIKKEIKKDKEFLAKNQIFLLPQEVTLKNCRWEIKHDFYEAGKFMFKVPKKKPLKGDKGHLQVTLKPEWQYLCFKFRNGEKEDEQVVPQYLTISGYNRAVSAVTPEVRSNILHKNNILIPWFLRKNFAATRDKTKITFGFKTEDVFVDTKKKKIVFIKAEDFKKKPLKEKFGFFDLPPLWISDNWQVNCEGWKRIASVTNKGYAADKPLTFYLDSITLTGSDLKSIAWNANNRFTIFDYRMRMFLPSANNPHWSKHKSLVNCIPAEFVPIRTRVVACNGKFYDVAFKRSIKGGDVVGARAAVLEDADFHCHEAMQNPYVNGAGNLELHYFHDCLERTSDDKTFKPTPYLLVYWSAEFTRNGVSQAAVNKFYKYGTKYAKQRWELKGYKFVPENDPNNQKLTIIPIFFFEGRTSNPKKCTVKIHPTGGAQSRSDMGITNGNFVAHTYKPSGAALTEVGKSFKYFTMSHELGHACGLDDEYLESLKEDNNWSPTLPNFKQYYDGMPYSRDENSMMVGNKAPRLRHYWYYCYWLSNTAGVKTFTKNTEFRVEGKRSSGTYKYYRKNDVLAPQPGLYYKHSYHETGYSNGTHGRMDLFLYKLGQDETTDVLMTGKKKFNGILLIRPKLYFEFQNAGGNNWANTNQKLAFLRNFQSKVDLALRKVYLTNSSDSYYKLIYAYFVPHYECDFSTNKYGSPHFTIKVLRDPTGNYEPDIRKKLPNGSDFSSTTFKIGHQQDPISVFRYILGLKAYKLFPVMIGFTLHRIRVDKMTIGSSDLKFLGEWVKTKRGNGSRHSVYKK
ncbi:MAG: hypothetical protein R3F48_16225 [Candidatus Zixiibacteriota bacterium]